MQWISSVLSPSKEGSFAAFGLGTSTTLSGGERGDAVSYGFSLMRGKRAGMEDYHSAEVKSTAHNTDPGRTRSMHADAAPRPATCS